jgi:hypothetical protein
LAKVASELNEAKVGIVPCRFKEGRYGPVTRTVVNVNDLVSHPGGFQDSRYFSESLGYVLFLVINWNYD